MPAMRNSLVSSLINFEFDKSPKWRKDRDVPPVGEMITEIVKFQMKWKKCKGSFDPRRVCMACHDCWIQFIYHTNVGEEHGYTTKEEIESCVDVCNNVLKLSQPELPVSEEKRKTMNIIEAYRSLRNEVKKLDDNDESEQLHGLLTANLIKDTHKQILKDLELPRNYTEPGFFSKNERFAEYKGELYAYQMPENMEESVQTLLDRYNDLITNCVKEEENAELRVSNMFKTTSWLLFELLDLHPFSDGNGRLCRLLCSYALSSMTPFPTPVYNVWSESSKFDYIEALVAARKSETRHPTSLASMLVECNYFGWKEFFSILEGETRLPITPKPCPCQCQGSAFCIYNAEC